MGQGVLPPPRLATGKSMGCYLLSYEDGQRDCFLSPETKRMSVSEATMEGLTVREMSPYRPRGWVCCS